MQYFNRTGQALAVCLGLLLTLPAFAEGTDSGTSVINSVTLSYQVNGGDLTATDSVEFLVDTKLQLDVTTGDSDWVTVTTGQEYTPGLSGVPAINFQVTNLSNAPTFAVVAVVDQDLTPVNLFSPPGGGASSFDEDSFIVAIDDGAGDPNNRRYDTDDTVLTVNASGFYDLGSLAEDATVNVMVVLDVPDSAAAGEYATYTLVAAVADGLETPIETDQSNNVAAGSTASGVNDANQLDDVERVFTDVASGNAEDEGFDFFVAGGIGGTGAQDEDNDGQTADSSGFVVRGVDLQVGKYAEVIYDPVSENKYLADGSLDPLLNEPKAIPGSVLMYVVGVSNEDAVFVADSIGVVDDIPDNAVGLFEPVDEGNQSGSTVNHPASVTVDVDPTAAVNNKIFTLPAVLDLDQIYAEDCDGTGAVTSFSGDTEVGPDTDTALPEVDITMTAACDPSDTAFVVYFVTVETSENP